MIQELAIGKICFAAMQHCLPVEHTRCCCQPVVNLHPARTAVSGHVLFDALLLLHNVHHGALICVVEDLGACINSL